jgi:hypothetical protein
MGLSLDLNALQVRIWHATTYRAETTLNYGMERVWALAASKDSNKCVCMPSLLIYRPYQSSQ